MSLLAFGRVAGNDADDIAAETEPLRLREASEIVPLEVGGGGGGGESLAMVGTGRPRFISDDPFVLSLGPFFPFGSL